MARDLDWSCKQGASLQGFVGHFFFLSFLRGGACFSMVIQPFKSMGRGITCLFKFVYLEDLSGLMWGIGNR